MDFLYVKALHIIFVVTWFAGLFYLPRIFIYHAEAQLKPEPDRSILTDQFKVMARKLWYIITWPSAILTITFGTWMVVLNPYLLQQPWFHLKLAFVAGLIIYHLATGMIFYNLQKDLKTYKSINLRLWNEVSTIFLIAVVFIVILKDTFSWIWGVLGIFLLAGILTGAVMWYKKQRSRN